MSLKSVVWGLAMGLAAQAHGQSAKHVEQGDSIYFCEQEAQAKGLVKAYDPAECQLWLQCSIRYSSRQYRQNPPRRGVLAEPESPRAILDRCQAGVPADPGQQQEGGKSSVRNFHECCA